MVERGENSGVGRVISTNRLLVNRLLEQRGRFTRHSLTTTVLDEQISAFDCAACSAFRSGLNRHAEGQRCEKPSAPRRATTYGPWIEPAKLKRAMSRPDNSRTFTQAAYLTLMAARWSGRMELKH